MPASSTCVRTPEVYKAQENRNEFLITVPAMVMVHGCLFTGVVGVGFEILCAQSTAELLDVAEADTYAVNEVADAAAVQHLDINGLIERHLNVCVDWEPTMFVTVSVLSSCHMIFWIS